MCFPDHWLSGVETQHVSSVFLSAYSELLKKLIKESHEILKTSFHVPPEKVNTVDLGSY